MSYKGSLRRMERVSNFLLVIVALSLGGFLSALGNKMLGDFDRLFKSPDSDSFQNKPALLALENQESALERRIGDLDAQEEAFRRSLNVVQRQSAREKQSFNDWIQARAAVGSGEDDAKVRERARALDDFRKAEDGWRTKMEGIETAKQPFLKKQSELSAEKERLEQEAEKNFSRAQKIYALKVFFARLGFVGPLLGLGIFLFVKARKSRFWPLAWGYILFSLYAFFVGLVPYLPSFGGYIRLAVGALLSFLAGYYLIKQLGRYLDRKRAELQASTQERAKTIKEETAFRAYKSHACPSCEKDFLLNKWSPGVRQAVEVRSVDDAPDFCAHCGLTLFGKCAACGRRNFLHFPFCSACGKTLQV